MNIAMCLKFLKNNKKARRISWEENYYIILLKDSKEFIDSSKNEYKLSYDDLISNDWEVYVQRLSFSQCLEKVIITGGKIRREGWLSEDYFLTIPPNALEYTCEIFSENTIVFEDFIKNDWYVLD